ncbi:histidine phosphatase family protein [Anaerobacillus sp. HL2]|nr:histidine phosphatase family protein [Anaerobacillus sp. HL2]
MSYLLRHGVTKANQEKRYLGWTNVSLVQDCLPDLSIPCCGFDAIYSSDLKRCIETVRLLYPNNSINIDPRLREIHFGRFEAKTYERIKK